jgi:hypothetical protein
MELDSYVADMSRSMLTRAAYSLPAAISFPRPECPKGGIDLLIYGTPFPVLDAFAISLCAVSSAYRW